MRYIVTVAALILSYGTTAGYAQQANVSAPGTHSCGKYLAAVHGHAPGKGTGFNDRWRGQFYDDHTPLHGLVSWIFDCDQLVGDE